MALTIREWRNLKEVSQQKLGDSLEPAVHPNTIAEWEKNPNKIPVGRAYQICEVLGISFDDVIFLPKESTEL